MPPRDRPEPADGPASPAQAQARAEWERVREAVAEVCALPTAERRERLARLGASADPQDRRVAALAVLEQEADGFLEPPPPQPPPAAATPDSTAPVYSPGDHVGPYTLAGLLGQGGMGQVYRARDERLLRDVAIKVLVKDLAGGGLLREARMVARLQHDNIAAIYDVLEAQGRLHIVMEHLEGATLGAHTRERRTTQREAAEYVRQILDGVTHAHGKGVIHCDLKPGNVFVLPSGQVKVLDFGLARLESPSANTTGAVVAGTPRYLAPERLFGAPATARTDVYSVGVILSDLLAEATTTPGGDARTPDAVADDGLRARLQVVASRAAAADAADRFPTAQAMRDALLEALRTPVPAVSARAGRPWLGLRARFAAAALLLSVTVAGAWTYLSSPRPPAVRPVVAVDLAGAAADPITGYLAAALEQLVVGSLSGTSGLVVVRPAPLAAGADAQAGATHVIKGLLTRAGPTAEVTLTLVGASGEVIASQTARAAIDDAAALAAAALDASELILRRAGISLRRTTLDPDLVRRSLDVQPEAFEEYAQAREYIRTPEGRGNLDHAIGLLVRAIARAPEFVLAHASLAEAYWLKYLATRDDAWTDKARAAALEAVRLNPNDPAVRYTLALIYRGMGRREDALSEVSKAIALQPTSDDMFRLRGRLHADMGRLDRALDDLATARTLRPGYWDNHRTTGLVLFEASRYDEAVEHFRRAAELRPSNASAYQALGTALQAAGRVDEALATYQKALAIAPSANTYSNIGKIHYDRGHLVDAVSAYEESARLQPKEPLTYRNLGDTLERLGRRKEARAAYERAIALAGDMLAVNPSNLDALSLQAICHAKLGHRPDATRLATQVLAEGRVTPTMRYRSGVALILVGQTQAGVEAVGKALDDGFSRSEAAVDVDLAAVRQALGLPVTVS